MPAMNTNANNPKTYANGDGITLGGCNSCAAATINGTKCHEHGCPDAWKDAAKECNECGATFFSPCGLFCSDACYADYCGVAI